MPRKTRALRRGTALSRSEKKQVGPVQIVVLGFEDLTFQGDILPELRRLRDLEVIRLVGMVIVAKSDSGELVRVKASDLTEEDSAQSLARSRARSSGSKGSEATELNPARPPTTRARQRMGISATSGRGRSRT